MSQFRVYSKPSKEISLADWYAQTYDLQVAGDTRIQDAFDLRYKARRTFNENITATIWEAKRNETVLQERLSDIELKSVKLNNVMGRLEREMVRLHEEKKRAEAAVDELTQRCQVVASCISNRNERTGLELTNDTASSELLKEFKIVQDGIKALEMKCQEAFQYLNNLDTTKFNLQLEMTDKKEAIDIDREQIKMTKDDAHLSFKLKPLRSPDHCYTIEQWEEHSFGIIMKTELDIQSAIKQRENLQTLRMNIQNLMEAQTAVTNYSMRKRVHETRKARNEIAWQKKMMDVNMDKLSAEIARMTEILALKKNASKLAETRLENRSYRPGYELCLDLADDGLKTEVMNGRQMLCTLTEELDKAKPWCSESEHYAIVLSDPRQLLVENGQATYNALEDQCIKIDLNLQGKEVAMSNDVQSLEIRQKLGA